MCNNIVVLYLFMFLKIAAIFIIPIVIFIKRKKRISKILTAIDIILLIFFLICNLFTVNSCVYNSNINGISRVKKENQINLFNTIHIDSNISYDSEGINPRYYKTFKGLQFYYYNQNDKTIGTREISCAGRNHYMNKYGSSITSVSMVVSTLLNRNITPVDIMNLYISNVSDCSNGINIEDIFKIITENYVSFNISDISGNDIENAIKDGGIVVAKTIGGRKSTLSCAESYIVIYNMTLEGKFIIADPDDSEYPYVCSYSSGSYGNVLKENRTNSEWSFEDLDSQISKYYLIKRL